MSGSSASTQKYFINRRAIGKTLSAYTTGCNKNKRRRACASLNISAVTTFSAITTAGTTAIDIIPCSATVGIMPFAFDVTGAHDKNTFSFFTAVRRRRRKHKIGVAAGGVTTCSVIDVTTPEAFAAHVDLIGQGHIAGFEDQY